MAVFTLNHFIQISTFVHLHTESFSVFLWVVPLKLHVCLILFVAGTWMRLLAMETNTGLLVFSEIIFFFIVTMSIGWVATATGSTFFGQTKFLTHQLLVALKRFR